jgi:hypothetical protein
MAINYFQLIWKTANRFMMLSSYGVMASPMDWLLRLRTRNMNIWFYTNDYIGEQTHCK